MAKTGLLVLAGSDHLSLPIGKRVRLVCRNSGCAPNIRVGKTKIHAKPPQITIIVTSAQVVPDSAVAGVDQSGSYTVAFTLNSQAAATCCAFTTRHVLGYVAAVLDGSVLIDPQISSAICGGQTQIVGLHNAREAEALASYLNYGPLPVPLRLSSFEAS